MEQFNESPYIECHHKGCLIDQVAMGNSSFEKALNAPIVSTSVFQSGYIIHTNWLPFDLKKYKTDILKAIVKVSVGLSSRRTSLIK